MISSKVPVNAFAHAALRTEVLFSVVENWGKLPYLLI
jgi:hypothetical protein